MREAAWPAWFGGDEAALRSMLPEDFLAIGWAGREISDSDQTIASSRDFRKSGGLEVKTTAEHQPSNA